MRRLEAKDTTAGSVPTQTGMAPVRLRDSGRLTATEGPRTSVPTATVESRYAPDTCCRSRGATTHTRRSSRIVNRATDSAPIARGVEFSAETTCPCTLENPAIGSGQDRTCGYAALKDVRIFYAPNAAVVTMGAKTTPGSTTASSGGVSGGRGSGRAS